MRARRAKWAFSPQVGRFACAYIAMRPLMISWACDVSKWILIAFHTESLIAWTQMYARAYSHHVLSRYYDRKTAYQGDCNALSPPCPRVIANTEDSTSVYALGFYRKANVCAVLTQGCEISQRRRVRDARHTCMTSCWPHTMDSTSPLAVRHDDGRGQALQPKGFTHVLSGHRCNCPGQSHPTARLLSDHASAQRPTPPSLQVAAPLSASRSRAR